MTPAQLSQGNILIIDDEEELLAIYKILLNDLTPHVHTANTCKEAFDLLEKQTIDVIMADIVMPMMSGIEFLKLLREKNCHSPIVFFSGAINDKIKQKALDVGAFGFVDKPCDDEVLFKKMKEALIFGLEQRRSHERP